jgi:hypothetical protein
LPEAESEEVAVLVATVALRTKRDWSHDSEARDTVLSRFAPVAQAVFADLPSVDDTEPPGPGTLKAPADFEDWYAQAHADPFWFLFENEMRETPVVDF